MRLVHYSAKPPIIKPTTYRHRRGHFVYKPSGLWVSDDDCNDNWPAWCRANGFLIENLAHACLITLRSGANILHLSSANDIDSFTRDYCWQPYKELSLFSIAWDRVYIEYDGIVISPYIWSRRLGGGADWYYGWDCAGGCIWNIGTIEANPEGPDRQPEPEKRDDP